MSPKVVPIPKGGFVAARNTSFSIDTMVDQEVDDSILSTPMEIDIVMLVVWVSIEMMLRYVS